MTPVKTADLISSVGASLQFISYYHPVDFVQAMLTPPDSIVDWVKQSLPAVGAGWYPQVSLESASVAPSS